MSAENNKEVIRRLVKDVYRELCKGEVRRILIPHSGVKIALAAAHFHGFGVARQGP